MQAILIVIDDLNIHNFFPSVNNLESKIALSSMYMFFKQSIRSVQIGNKRFLKKGILNCIYLFHSTSQMT